jgi:FMN phosphatase YigB (HAD superfamily)
METEKKKTKWIFDLDNTLIYTDEDSLKQHNYLTLKPEKTLPLFSLMQQLLKRKKDVYIMTNRHPKLQAEIAELTGVPIQNIFCRTYNLDNKEPPKGKQLLAFLHTMSVEKMRKLNTLAKDAVKVFFFDDMIGMYKKLRLQKNIQLFGVTKSDIAKGRHLSRVQAKRGGW